MNERFFHGTMIVAALAFMGVSAVGLQATRIVLQPNQYVSKIAWSLVLLSGAAFYRWRNAEKAVNLCMITFWTGLFGILYKFPMFIACRSHVEPNDGLLAAMDRAIGIEVPEVLKAMGNFPSLNRFLTACYGSLIALMTIAIIVPPLHGKMRQAKEYILATLMSAIIGIPLFSVFQAVGPWVHYGYQPVIAQEKYLKTFYEIKTAGVYELDINYSNGLICFPSYHTILAILAATALWKIPYVRIPAAILAILIIVSTVTTGTHYVVDVVAGVFVTILSVLAARLYTRAETAWEGGFRRVRRLRGERLRGAGPVLQPIMPLNLPVKVRSWELTVNPRSHIRR